MKNFYQRNRGNFPLIYNCFVSLIKNFELTKGMVNMITDSAFKNNLEFNEKGFDGAGTCDQCSWDKCPNRHDYDHFIAECYEAEDEFWKGIFEEIEADYWINENKKNKLCIIL